MRVWCASTILSDERQSSALAFFQDGVRAQEIGLGYAGHYSVRRRSAACSGNSAIL